jgi:hypothetical protein
MSRTRSQHTIDRAIMRLMLSMNGYLCAEDVLRDEVDNRVPVPPTRSELDDSIRHLDSSRYIISGEVATGRAWKITADGRAWAAENRIMTT